MRFDAERLMELLPSVYRLRDEQRHELRALLEVIAEQAGVLEKNLGQLYDDLFIETCAAWVIPYIADLLGSTPLAAAGSDADDEPRRLFPDLAGPHFVPRVALRGRADAAKTIYFRKRKATLTATEELARDVTGWTAHVVEFFRILRWSQCVRHHLRPSSHAFPDLRRRELLDRLGGPFDDITHNVDVRPINQRNGWYETRNVGVFLWRLKSYGISDGDARAGDQPHRFFIHPVAGIVVPPPAVGVEAPLFTRAGVTDGAGVTEDQVPSPIRQSFFRASQPLIYGDGRSLSISTKEDGPIPAECIVPCDLSKWPRRPAGDVVAVDVATGRIAFGYYYKKPTEVQVSYHYGFSADLGGGPYARSGWLVRRGNAQVIDVEKGTALDTLAKALAKWRPAREDTVIVLHDDRTYVENEPLVIDPPAGGFLAIEAVDHARPHIQAAQPILLQCGDGATVTLSGLLVEGSLQVGDGTAGHLRLFHTTLVPVAGKISVSVPASAPETFRLEMAFSITGALRVPATVQPIGIFDCIVDGVGAAAIDGTSAAGTAPPLRIERSTVFGGVRVRQLPLATETIFTGALDVDRRQEGCARFSFIPAGSRTPRRFRCQPDLEIATRVAQLETRFKRRLATAETAAIAAAVRAFLLPSFTSRQYGQPGYAQLHLGAPRQITRGAEDGSEMGAFCHLKQPQREANLRTRLAEYVPFGLEPGIIDVT
jgi:hypothetical protein